jgi:hypothetical protein
VVSNIFSTFALGNKKVMIMENNKKLQMFVNDTYDVLAGNSEYCTQEEYSKRYGHNEIYVNCTKNIIVIDDFQITITLRKK